MARQKIVCVEWEDSSYVSGYYDKDKPDNYNPVFTRTVGHLVRKTKIAIIVSQDRFYDKTEKKPEDDRHISVIPKKMIRRIRELQEVR